MSLIIAHQYGMPHVIVHQQCAHYGMMPHVIVEH